MHSSIRLKALGKAINFQNLNKQELFKANLTPFQ